MVKLGDFNIITRVNQFNKILQEKGTQGFIAPELIWNKKGLYSNKVDIFSLGSVIHELIALRIPFEKEGAPELISKGVRPRLYKKHRSYPVLLLDLMFWCWEPKCEVRPDAKQVLKTLLHKQFTALQVSTLYKAYTNQVLN